MLCSGDKNLVSFIRSVALMSRRGVVELAGVCKERRSFTPDSLFSAHARIFKFHNSYKDLFA